MSTCLCVGLSFSRTALVGVPARFTLTAGSSQGPRSARAPRQPYALTAAREEEAAGGGCLPCSPLVVK